MNLPQIRMESVFIQLGLQIDKPIQSIEQPKATQTIEQPKANMDFRTTPGKLTIDQTEARADMDLKSIRQRIKEFAENGYQDFLEGMARRREQGDELMKIEKKGNPLIEQAVINGNKREKQFNIGWIPSHFSVKIHYEPAKVETKIEPQKPIIETKINRPIHEYKPGKVNMFIERWNSLKIDFVNVYNEKI